MDMVGHAPSVLVGVLEESDHSVECTYNDGGTYSDGYGDAGYGDYSDSADPDPTGN